MIFFRFFRNLCRSQPVFLAIIALFLVAGQVAAWTTHSLQPLVFKPTDQNHSAWSVGGHFELGLFANQYGSKNSYRSPYSSGLESDSGNSAELLNVHQSDFQLNQAWFFLEKRTDLRRTWDIGGRLDFVFGTDAKFLQSDGLERNAGHGGGIDRDDGHWGSGDYYSALAQIYLKVQYKNLDLKIGKFLSPLGNDSIISTERFFYSLSKSFELCPTTQTGILATWNFGRKISTFAGWSQGADEFGESGKNNGFLVGFVYNLNPRTDIGCSVFAVDNGYSDGFYDSSSYEHHCIAMKCKLDQRWSWLFEWVYMRRYGHAFGINNSFFYTINDRWTAGLRMEWLNSAYNFDNADYYEITFGINWKPLSWFLIRPELRYDSLNGSYDPFDQGGANKQFSYGFSAIVKF